MTGLMKNFNCPNCHQPTISFWRRQIIGPTAPAECSNCGADVTVTWVNMLWPLIPWIVLWAISEQVESSTLYWMLNIAGFVLTTWLTNQFVPLITKTPASNQRVQP
ncbi:MAG: hypothetical protein ACXWJW_02335 [Xanthobacteraceae bacterium]